MGTKDQWQMLTVKVSLAVHTALKRRRDKKGQQMWFVVDQALNQYFGDELDGETNHEPDTPPNPKPKPKKKPAG